MVVARSLSNGRWCSDLTKPVSEDTAEGHPPAKRRRTFLQTMGQQLREVQISQDNPEEDAPNLTGEVDDIPHVRSPVERTSTRQIQIQTPESDSVPGENDQLPTGASISASKPIWHSDETIAAFGSNVSEITFEDLVAWTSSYFYNWHPAYPFLHAPSLLDQFDRIVSDGSLSLDSLSGCQLIVLRSIMSISLADRRQIRSTMRPVPVNLIFSSFNESIRSVQQALTDESSVESLQAVISVELFLLSMLRYNAAARLQGLAARMAFQLRLHRCPMRLNAFPREEAQLRKRLFWSMYCLDRYISIRLGIPLSIRDGDVDVCWPTSEQHLEDDPDNPDHDDRLDLLIFLSRHAEIRGRIMDLRNRSDSQSQVETDEAIMINCELTKWWNDVDEYLEPNSAGSPPIGSYHWVTLLVLRHEAIIALNKHTLATSKKSSTYNAALQNCIEASRSIINALCNMVDTAENLDTQRNPNLAAQEDTNGYALFWPSFTWAVWMSAFIMLYAANEDQVSQDAATRLADKSLGILKNLDSRGTAWPRACAAAIRDLRGQLIEKKASKPPDLYSSPRPQRPPAEIMGPPLRDSMVVQPESVAAGMVSVSHISTQAVSTYQSQRITQGQVNTTWMGGPLNPQGYPPTLTASDVESSCGVVSRPAIQPGLDGSLAPIRQNWPSVDPSSSVYANMGISGMNQQFNSISHLNDDGPELFYGLETPFWTNGGQ